MKLKERWSEEIIRDATTFGGFPFSVMMIPFLYLENKELIIPFIMTQVIFHGISFIIRFLFFKERPNKQDHYSLLSKLDASSFPSIHAGRAVIVAVMLGQVYQHVWVLILLGIGTLMTLYSRIYLKKHDWKDVVVGAAVGFLITYMIA